MYVYICAVCVYRRRRRLEYAREKYVCVCLLPYAYTRLLTTEYKPLYEYRYSTFKQHNTKILTIHKLE
jgi:alkyl hydroperoxide reductase subunit AhpC